MSTPGHRPLHGPSQSPCGQPCASVQASARATFGRSSIASVATGHVWGSLAEQLTENPIALAIIAALVLFTIGRYVWRWRRESALRDQASERGWRPVEDGEAFADLVTRQFPELWDEAEQDARAARRSGSRRGARA